MDKLWISILILLVLLKEQVTNGQSEVEVQLIVRKYVEKGSSVTLFCDHNVKQEILYKVSWLKSGGNKFFEYINGRNPPYRNFTIAGANIDPINSNQNQVTLKNIDFEAAGLYFCEVSTESPIFTKASNDEQLHVILPQTGPPKIVFSKHPFYVGEKLVANCTTSKARPLPHITWLINGKKVDEKHIRPFHPYSSNGKNSHRSKSHQQNNPSYDKSEAGELYSKVPMPKEEPYEMNVNSMGDEIYHGFNHENTKETIQDNKYFDTKKYRNSYTRKNRRYVNEGGNRNSHKGTISSSQLSIEVSELHAGSTGRLEITCLATIPAHVGPGEQFADYKTFSVKIDIENAETTSIVPSRIGASALDGNSGITIHTTNKLIKFILILFIIPVRLISYLIY